MKNTTIISIIVLVIAGAFLLMGGGLFGESNGTYALIHKSPTCGCCGIYGKYLERLGYDVEYDENSDMAGVKSSFGIPGELESCHTAEIGGYVVEGHMPHEAIEKLLAEGPKIKGIGLAGMPQGSPGMSGTKIGAFEIHEIIEDGMMGGMFLSI